MRQVRVIVAGLALGCAGDGRPITALELAPAPTVGLTDVFGAWRVQFVNGVAFPAPDQYDTAYHDMRADSGWLDMSSVQRFTLRIKFRYGLDTAGLSVNWRSAGRWTLTGDTLVFTDTLATTGGHLGAPGVPFRAAAKIGTLQLLLNGRKYDAYRL